MLCHEINNLLIVNSECHSNMQSAEHLNVVLESPESVSPIWDSRINVCPGSSPTVDLSSPSLNADNDSDKESKPCSNLSSSEESDSLTDWGSVTSWPDLDIPGTWGTQGLEETPWEDEKKPCTKFRKYQDLELNEVERKGVLTDRSIAASSSDLDKSPETGKYVLCKVNLSHKLLTDISIIEYHHYLQYVDLSWNELTDVEALGQLPFLMYLNLSHNLLTKVLNFRAPFNLTYVNYSHNDIDKIDDLTNFWSIIYLDLSYNHISVIEGIQQLKYLRHLNLSYNIIESIENLNNMKLLTLDLHHNNIVRFEEGDNVGFKTLIDILRINLGHNHLKSLRLFEGIAGIQSINIVHNFIDDLMEITHLRGLNFLTEVDFRGNPIVNIKFYVEVCVNTIKYLYVLDGETVDAEKKVLAKNSSDPSDYMQAIRKSSNIFFLQQINEPFLGPPIVPVDQPPPPIIILVGPPGSNKSKLIQIFCKQHNRLTILGVSHTTRGRNEEEVEGEAYYFINGLKFRTMMANGEFLTVSQTLGNYFGLAQSEIGKTVNKSGVLVLHMNLSGALTLRTRGLRCYLVLAMTSTVDIHRQWLFEKYYTWHDSNRFLGAVEVQNCPIKAKQFLSECDKNLKLAVKVMAGEIVTETVHDAIKIVDGVDEHVSIENNGSDENNNTGSESSIDSVKVSPTSSRTSGILKSPTIQSKAVDTSHFRVSVTFQNENEIPSTDTSRSQVRVQTSRSVTFNDIQNEESSEQLNQSKYSISKTIVHGHDSGMNLSVLSRPKRDSVETYPIAWDIQTTALNAAVEEIINTRDAYLDVHYSNPGLFTEVIFTDDFIESLTKLKKLLKKCVKSQPSAKPNYQVPRDAAYKKMLATRLESLHKDIESEMSITQKQQDSASQTKLFKEQKK